MVDTVSLAKQTVDLVVDPVLEEYGVFDNALHTADKLYVSRVSLANTLIRILYTEHPDNPNRPQMHDLRLITSAQQAEDKARDRLATGVSQANHSVKEATLPDIADALVTQFNAHREQLGLVLQA